MSFDKSKNGFDINIQVSCTMMPLVCFTKHHKTIKKLYQNAVTLTLNYQAMVPNMKTTKTLANVPIEVEQDTLSKTEKL